jgi:hypothetical protein
MAFGSFGPLDFTFEWLIPGVVVTLPGVLILVVFAIQVLAGTAWLPVVRREIGDFGLRRSRRRG